MFHLKLLNNILSQCQMKERYFSWWLLNTFIMHQATCVYAIIRVLSLPKLVHLWWLLNTFIMHQAAQCLRDNPSVKLA